jgi:hypothetical protein
VLDPTGVLPVTPKLPCPDVQLEAPLLTPAGFAVLLLVPAGFAAEALAVVAALDKVALALGWVPGCCVCACIWAIPAQNKTIAARIAIKNALPVFAPLMV